MPESFRSHAQVPAEDFLDSGELQVGTMEWGIGGLKGGGQAQGPAPTNTGFLWTIHALKGTLTGTGGCPYKDRLSWQ